MVPWWHPFLCRNGCSLTGRGSIFEASLQRRPQTSESVALEEPLVWLGLYRLPHVLSIYIYGINGIQCIINIHVLYIYIYGINGIQDIINTHVLSIYSIHHRYPCIDHLYGINGIQYIINTHVLSIYSIHHWYPCIVHVYIYMGLMGFNTSLIPMYCPYIQYTIDTHVLSMYIYIWD